MCSVDEPPPPKRRTKPPKSVESVGAEGEQEGRMRTDKVQRMKMQRNFRKKVRDDTPSTALCMEGRYARIIGSGSWEGEEG